MTVGSVFGVRLRVHPVFALLLCLAAATGHGVQALLLLILLGTHELAHLVTAGAYGLDVREVELWPFGGVARIADLEWAAPGVEAAVALAGPLNNLALLAAGQWLRGLGWEVGSGEFFVASNIVLGLANLLPALPLDGGRLLRSMLASRLGYGNATARLLVLGRWVAVACCLAGCGALAAGRIVPGLFFYGVFLLAASGAERRSSRLHVLRRLWRGPVDGPAPAGPPRVSPDEAGARGRSGEGYGGPGHGRGAGGPGREHPARISPLLALAAAPEASLADVLARMTSDRYHLVWVVDRGGRALGCLDEAALLDGVREHGPATALGLLVGRPPRRC